MSRLLRYLREVVVACLGLGVAAVLGALLFVLAQMSGAGELPAGQGTGGCALVFGSASPASIDRRVGRAAALYREGSVQRLVLSGGGKSRDLGEVETIIMRRRAIALDIHALDIVMESQSTSTVENLLLSRPYVRDCQTIVAVSDRAHLGRIRLLAMLLSVPLDALVPAEPTSPLSEGAAALRETAKILVTVPPLVWDRVASTVGEVQRSASP